MGKLSVVVNWVTFALSQEIGVLAFSVLPRSLMRPPSSHVPADGHHLDDKCRHTNQLRFVSAAELTEQLDFTERFDRWRFLARLLDDEIDDRQVLNQVLYHALNTYLNHPRPRFENTDETGSPERTDERLQRIQKVLDDHAQDESLNLLLQRKSSLYGQYDGTPAELVYNQTIFDDLQSLLPDPEEEEDDFKSTWDIIIELNGRESVKINERDNHPPWRANCLMGRLLVFYDFLVFGLLPEQANASNAQ